MNGEAPRSAGRVPPHSREAEESLLGALLLSSDAANEVMDRIHPEDFYVPAHQSIYESMRRLYDANQAIDAVTLSEELRRSGELEKVGGVSYLTRLVDVVPVTSNVEHYATIVEENGRRRDLIRAGSSVTTIAFDLDDEIHSVMDRAEQAVLSVAERRASQNMIEVGPLFSEVLEQIELLESQGSEITGLATGFRDLDKKLAGLQNANLVIIAARPAMGKCLAGSTLLTDAVTGERFRIEDVVANPEAHAGLKLHAFNESTGKLVVVSPSGFLDQGEQDTYEVVTRLGREIQLTSGHPVLTLMGWRKLEELEVGDAIAVPSSLKTLGEGHMTEGEAALLGYLLGDGTLRGTTPRFTTSDARMRDEVAELVRPFEASLHHKGGLEYSIVSNRHVTQMSVAAAAGVSQSTVSLVLAGKNGPSEATRRAVIDQAATSGYDAEGPSNRVTAWLRDLQLWGCGAGNKFVPKTIFGQSLGTIAAFLNRLYATDGSAWVSGSLYRIEYCSISRQLARDVQHLLLRFGIQAKIRPRCVQYGASKVTAYDVSFQDPDNVETFAERVGIFGKEDQLERVVELSQSGRLANRSVDRFPLSIWDEILQAKGERSWASISLAAGKKPNHNWHPYQRKLTRRTLTELARSLENEELARRADSDLTWDPIVSIEPKAHQKVYDLTIPVHHNFVANDIVVHNSALMMNIATNVAGQGKPVALFSLEMSKEEIVQRILSSVGRVDSMKLRSGQLGPLWQRVVDAASRMYQAPIFIDDSPIVTVTDIRAKCRRLKRKMGLSLVVVDYLQLMQGTARENRQQEIAEISRNLKNLARELEVPVIGLSQLNRSLEAREDKRPRLSDLRESGSLEQDADVVMFIYRHEYYHPEDQENKGLAEVIVAKHRAGATGTVRMTFLPEFTRFADLGRDVT